MDKITKELIQRNINEEFYEGIKNAMCLYNGDRFAKPTIAQLITMRTQTACIKNGYAWITSTEDKHFNNVLTTEIFIQQQEKSNNGLAEMLFEAAIIPYFENDENCMIRRAMYDRQFYVIELSRVFVKNKEFYNLLMSTLKARYFYKYPTLVIVDKDYMSYSKDDVPYYDYKEIVELGYFDVRKLSNLCVEREAFTGERLNRIVHNATSKK